MSLTITTLSYSFGAIICTYISYKFINKRLSIEDFNTDIVVYLDEDDEMDYDDVFNEEMSIHIIHALSLLYSNLWSHKLSDDGIENGLNDDNIQYLTKKYL